MRADVLIPAESHQHQADGFPSVDSPLHTPIDAPNNASRVAIESVSFSTVLRKGGLGTWLGLMKGETIEDHARVRELEGARRAARLAEFVAKPLTGAGFARDAAVVVGTSKGSVEDWLAGPPPVRPENGTSDNSEGGLSVSGLGDIAAELARITRTRGPVLTVSAACASGLHALIRGVMLIRAGEARQVLVVATEASVHPLFLGSFQRLGVLAKPGEGCRPFDRNRTGFYMTEAAAAVLLEAVEPDGSLRSQRAALRQRSHPQQPVFVDRFALGGDATHLTSGDPNGRVLRHLLRQVIAGRPVDLIHAHGTGTEMNDATELAAIDETVIDQPDRPVVYSHKAALGHSLGASGLLAVVINCLSHTTGEIPPNVRTTDPLPARRVVIPQSTTRRSVRRSLAIAAGFGGPVAVVSLTSD